MSVSLEICDVSKIDNAMVKIEKTKMTIQGTNYYKNYEIPKGVSLKFNDDNKKLFATFEFDFLKKKINVKNKNNKFFTLLKDSINYNNITENLNMWNLLIFKSEKLNDFQNLSKHEKNFRIKSHLLYNDDFININTIYGLKNNEGNISLCKKSENEIYVKTTGGIIFDSGNCFIEKFNKSLSYVKNSHVKNYLISDIIPHQKNNLNFTFKHIKNIDDTKFEHTRLIIYHPTKEIISKLLYFIGNKITKPRVLWIVLPYPSHDFLNYSEILSILFWTNTFYKMYNPSITALMCENNINQLKNQIVIEKIKYKLSQDEIDMLPKINYENINILEKIYLYSLGEQLPKKIYDTNECQICCSDLTNMSCVSCGHVFCTHCIIEILKTKHSCPHCRRTIKYNDVNIQKLTSLTKMVYLLSLLKSLNKDSLTIIYTDTFTLAKKVMMYLNNFEQSDGNDNVCNILNQKYTYKQQKNEHILICPIENDFLCQSIKNIKNIIIFTTVSNYSLKSESLGYDYCYNNFDVKVWLFECEI